MGVICFGIRVLLVTRAVVRDRLFILFCDRSFLGISVVEVVLVSVGRLVFFFRGSVLYVFLRGVEGDGSVRLVFRFSGRWVDLWVLGFIFGVVV